MKDVYACTDILQIYYYGSIVTVSVSLNNMEQNIDHSTETKIG